jgi:hypothetical protein
MEREMAKEVSNNIEHMPAVTQVNTGMLLNQLMMLINSNMAGDGKFSDKQIKNQASLTSVAIRVVELELKMNRYVGNLRATR